VINSFKRFAANRYNLKGVEFSKAMNEVFVVFNDIPNVMECLSKFHEVIVSKQPTAIADDALIKLFKAMCQATDISYEQFNDAFFLTPFNTVPGSMNRPELR
jgi:hypothetical protein